MALVITPFSYGDGNVLVPEFHNKNIYSDNSGEGIVSEPNGGLDVANLAAGFQVNRDHVWPGAVLRAEAGNSLRERHFTDDIAWDWDDGEGSFVSIPGAGLRFVLPFDVSLAVVQWSYWISPHRANIDKAAADDSATPAIFTKAFWDDTALDHTLRRLPETYFFGTRAATTAATTTTTGIGQRKPIPRELRNARHYDISTMIRNVSRGMHSLDMRLYMEPVSKTDRLWIKVKGREDVTWWANDFELHNRVSIATVHARVVCLL